MTCDSDEKCVIIHGPDLAYVCMKVSSIYTDYTIAYLTGGKRKNVTK